MTTSKLIDNNRRTHAAKVLAQASKKNQLHEHETTENEATETSHDTDSTTTARSEMFSSLNEQYTVIREDILKLREDLAHGYDLVKEMIDSKLSIKSLLRSK